MKKVHSRLIQDNMPKPDVFASELLLPDINDRSFWEGISADYIAAQLEFAERELEKPWEQLLASEYISFSKTGERERFEKKYFSRRKKLTDLVVAECMENKGRFLPYIVDGLYLILEENGWCIPAHNSYIRDEKQYPLQNPECPVIDLFAAETGAVIGIAERLLRPRLLEISPFISKYVDKTIRERITEPYINRHFWWMGDGKSPMLNWTPWITQNIILAVFSRVENRNKESMLRQAAVSLDFFLDEYGEDGCCSEGAEYYTHAGLCLFTAVFLLDRLSGGRMSRIFHTDKIRNMGNYIVNMYVGEGRYLNFADCSPYAGVRNARDFLFAKASDNEEYARFSAYDYQHSGFYPSGEDKNGRLLLSEQNLFYRLLQAENEREMLKYPAEEPHIRRSFYYESIGLFIAGDSVFTLAVKAGNNADAHNHNDCGSVILYRKGKPLLIDLGVETYTQKTFSDKRYEIWTMQSSYHNLPGFRGISSGYMPIYEIEIQQKAGEKYCARDVVWEMSDKESRISMELSAAYSHELIREYRRTVSFREEREIAIEDHYEGDGECILSLIFSEEPELTASEIIIGDYSVEHNGAADMYKERLKIEDARLRRAWKQDCWRVLLRMKDRDIALRFPYSHN